MTKKSIVLIGYLLFLHFYSIAQENNLPGKKVLEDTIEQRIVLIGDAGELMEGNHPVVDAIRQYIKLDKKTTIIYLGDNLYPLGLPNDRSSKYNSARAILDSQLLIAKNTPAKVFMIPGNHDWESGHRGGYDAIVREQVYVDFLKIPNVKYFPEDGCPGPVEISLGNNVTMIVFDSQWWLHPYDKPGIESDCNSKTKEELVTQIEEIAIRNAKKLIILACHHPFKSNGTHGNAYKLKQHIFPLTDFRKNLYIPLPVIGSIYPLARGVFGSPQDLKYPAYSNMVKEISNILKDIPNIVFVSGHDHNLQHIVDSNHNYIVSGSGGYKQNRTVKHPNSLFNSNQPGFGVLEVSKNKNVNLTFYTVIDSFHSVYAANLLNFKSIPAAAVDTSAQVEVDIYTKYKDSVSVPASDNYPMINGLRKFFMGQNYRQEWSTPVSMKVFNLRKESGGFNIISLGGGKQTKSLRLENKTTGKDWVLRSVNKSTLNTIPENFRGTLAEYMSKELNTSSHPYASLIVPELANALNIPVARPRLFFVPDDPALGYFRPLFANTICMLEEHNASLDDKKTITTAKMFNHMLEDNDHRPDSQLVLKARLLDMVIADYDRHFDQWKWGAVDSTRGSNVKGKIYYPIPRDRDQAFFRSDGFIMKMISGRAIPFLRGFRSNIQNINWLGYTARDFDRVFLTDIDRKEWEKSIADLQNRLTDSVIRNAVKKLPPEIYSIRSESITQRMIRRRNEMTTAGIKYYRFIAKTVNVIGSNEKEYFKVNNTDDGLQVRVYARSKDQDTNFIIFNRIFHRNETKEVRLYGLNNDDRFEIDSSAKSTIKIRIIGGKGQDTFDLKGNVESLLYDITGEENIILNNRHVKNRFSATISETGQSFLGFEYNTTRLPQIHFNYNPDDALIIGAGISKRTYGFRNLPYASDQHLSFLYAPNRKAFQAAYRGEINHFTRNYDIVIEGKYANPALRNFFGIGNNTKIDATKSFTYYQTRYKSFEIEALFRKRILERLQLMFGPYYYSYQNNYKDNINTILGKRNINGFDSTRLFSNKSYLGAKFVMQYDNTNNTLFPTRGFVWHNELLTLGGLSGNARTYVKASFDITIYASFTEPAKLVFVLKAGGGKNFTKNNEFFQAQTFGLENGLTGFRKNRYAGNSSFYTSLEMKVKLFTLNSYLIPGTIGFTSFVNAGRVGIEDDTKKFHGAFGGGLYFLPFNLFMISGTVGISDGDKLFNFTLGTKINLSY